MCVISRLGSVSGLFVSLQIMDWMCLLLDAQFTVMVMLPEAKDLLSNLHKFVRAQVSCIFWDNSLIFSWIQNMDVENRGRQTTTNYIVNQIMSVLLCMLCPEHELQLTLCHLDFKSCFIWFKYLKLCRTRDNSTVWWCTKERDIIFYYKCLCFLPFRYGSTQNSTRLKEVWGNYKDWTTWENLRPILLKCWKSFEFDAH